MSIHVRFACKLFALAACATSAGSALAPAADNTRYVSITGSNANNCTLAAPCRTLQRGINRTPAGGELHILDSGDYGPSATIGKSMTISGNGHTVYLGSPITINGAGAAVALRKLTLNGQSTITIGVQITAAQTVHIERCLIHRFTEQGALVTATGGEVFILDSILRDNGGQGLLVPNEASSLVTIDNSRFENNGLDGVRIHKSKATINRSTASGNGSVGINVNSSTVSIVSTVAAQNGLHGFAASANSTMTVESSLASGNGIGLRVTNGGIARISNSTFTGNSIGIQNLESTLETRQNNTVRGNMQNVSGGLTLIGGT